MKHSAPVDTSPVTEGVTLFKYKFLLLLIIIAIKILLYIHTVVKV